jgi:hypothetical protein
MQLRIFILSAMFILAGADCAWAQPSEAIYCRQNAFRIPFQIDAGEQARLKLVELYVAEDGTKNWKLFKTVGPTERHFPFRAERDGTYSFLVRTVDSDGRAFPAAVEGASPGLRVIVDTMLPTATLRALPGRQEQVGVEWEVRDTNLDPATLQLEYRGQNGGEWQLVSAEPAASGQKYWTPSIRGPLEVRIRVKDKAENQGSAYIFLNGGGGSGGNPGLGNAGGRPSNEGGRSSNPYEGGTGRSSPPYEGGAGGVAPRAIPSAKVINTTDIVLNYSLEDVGPSGVSAVELWHTTDGRTWQKYGDDPDKQSPFVMKVQGEGVYGLTLCVKSGVGLGDRAPQPGDPPQMWIEVDTTKPLVQLLSAEAGRGGDHGNVTITWTASDKNLLATPITLQYAEELTGPWKPIATDLDNSGRYVWRVPAGTPFKFFVRVEAVDRGGNIGRADSSRQVLVDLNLPKGRLLGAEGSGK